MFCWSTLATRCFSLAFIFAVLGLDFSILWLDASKPFPAGGFPKMGVIEVFVRWLHEA